MFSNVIIQFVFPVKLFQANMTNESIGIVRYEIYVFTYFAIICE